MKRIDTHLHLWDLSRLPYSWCAGLPALNRSFWLEDYLTPAKASGITQAVFMEGNVDEPHGLAEAQAIQSLAAQNPLIAGIVAGARPERADFAQQLEALLQLPKLRGIRRGLHVVPDAISQAPLFAQNIRSLAAHRLTFDLCVLARQLPLAISLARRCAETQFVLDHCGVPDVRGKAFDPWRCHMAELAALPNVACKLSGIVAYASETWSVDDLRPWWEHVLACFGWDRVIWGGDWPVCTVAATLPQWAAATAELVRDARSEQKARLYSENAERIYRL